MLWVVAAYNVVRLIVRTMRWVSTCRLWNVNVWGRFRHMEPQMLFIDLRVLWCYLLSGSLWACLLQRSSVEALQPATWRVNSSCPIIAELSELTGDFLASDRGQTADVLRSEMSLMDVSDAVYRPKSLKKVRCTLLNVTERSSRWLTAATQEPFFCSMMSPLLTDRGASGHISAQSSTIPVAVLPFCWNSVFPRVNLPDHLTWQSSSDLF